MCVLQINLASDRDLPLHWRALLQGKGGCSGRERVSFPPVASPPVRPRVSSGDAVIPIPIRPLKDCNARAGAPRDRRRLHHRSSFLVSTE